MTWRRWRYWKVPHRKLREEPPLASCKWCFSIGKIMGPCQITSRWPQSASPSFLKFVFADLPMWGAGLCGLSWVTDRHTSKHWQDRFENACPCPIWSWRKWPVARTFEAKIVGETRIWGKDCRWDDHILWTYERTHRKDGGTPCEHRIAPPPRCHLPCRGASRLGMNGIGDAATGLAAHGTRGLLRKSRVLYSDVLMCAWLNTGPRMHDGKVYRFCSTDFAVFWHKKCCNRRKQLKWKTQTAKVKGRVSRGWPLQGNKLREQARICLLIPNA